MLTTSRKGVLGRGDMKTGAEGIINKDRREWGQGHTETGLLLP